MKLKRYQHVAWFDDYLGEKVCAIEPKDWGQFFLSADVEKLEAERDSLLLLLRRVDNYFDHVFRGYTPSTASRYARPLMEDIRATLQVAGDD